MCGIVGVSRPGSIDKETFVQMRDELTHRGPDGTGLYITENKQTALGFRRLSIIDLTDAGNQPMANETDDVYLLFNGEIYNYRDLRGELLDRGHEFTSETDSEVILHGYEEWGTDVLQRLRGMFAFAIWDETTERFFLARDRLGIKPLYYLDGEDQFAFASEPKAILADDSVERSVSSEGLIHFLKYRYVPAPLTIWEGMRKLPQGHYMLYEDGEARVEQYWDPESYLGEDSPPVEEATDDLRDVLEDSVQSHLVSDVPLGVLLSGGVDSSLVSALASNGVEGLSAFSMGFEPPDRSELEHSRKVAGHLNLDYTESVLSPEKLEGLLADLIYYYDEPLADTSIFPTFLLMQQVSEHLKVALSGDGGDELFAGYVWYDRYLRYQQLKPLAGALRSLQPLMNQLSRRFESSILSILDREVTRATLRGIDQYRDIMHPGLDDEELDRLLGEEMNIDLDDWDDQVGKHAGEEMSVKDLQFLDLNTFLPDDILVKVDRASMANSLEVRVPLLDHQLVEHALGLDEDLLYRDGEKKHLLKRIAREEVPSEVVDRPKEGFGAPLDSMGFISEYRQVLTDSQAATDGIFEQEALSELVEEASPSTLFKLILFEYWYRYWVEGQPLNEAVQRPD